VTAERRLNLLTGDWVLVSPHRNSRPWQGAAEHPASLAGIAHDPGCYLCPGNARAGGTRNPAYEGVWFFDNDFPALLSTAAPETPADDLLRAEPETGICRVVCYGPHHGRTMASMSATEIRAVVDVWAAQFTELSRRPDIGAVTIFENRGSMMGASNPHPHGQIWATGHIPNELAREDASQRDWFAAHGEPLLTAYLRREIEAADRIVIANDHFVALVPWWAAWPFETLVVPRRPVAALDELGHHERDGLADILSRVTALYDRLFDTPFPYTFGFHQRPATGQPAPHFVMHAHFYPPLLRSASIRKHMVGFEMLAMPQRDLTPETAAAALRACLP
jgi:UDPglucose--hexose-1-phosphate uridylyltransferase